MFRFITNFIIWRVVKSKIPELDEEWLLLKEKYDNIITGTKTRTPRDQLCLKSTKRSLTYALSHLYIKNFFGNETKQKASEMFQNIIEVFRKSLEENDWMEDKTRVEALKKLNNMKLFVGYPDQLMDESKIAEYYQSVSLSFVLSFNNS